MGADRTTTKLSSELPIIAVASLGGTITMMPTDDGGIAPNLQADQLLASVPGLEDICQIRATTLLTAPGASLTIPDVITAVQWARDQVDQGAIGAVLIQGTDTLEETSYAAELLWDREAPLVFVGAMRGPAQLSADGPANLMAAARVATADQMRGTGVSVVLDNTIHHASKVYKGHTTALSAFKSYDGLILGNVIEGNVHVRPFQRLGDPLGTIAPEKVPYVPCWTTWLGDDGASLRHLLKLNPAGIVVSAFGVGHVSFGLADQMASAAQNIPVVLTSRITEGGSMKNTYGFPGSEMDLLARGVISAGALDCNKARILLSFLLANGLNADQIKTEFATRGKYDT